MKTYLAAGDVLLNPELLAYAVVETDSEGQRLHLGFIGHAADAQAGLVVTGPEARSILRWLRSNAEFLDAGGPYSARTRRIGRLSGGGLKASPVGAAAGPPAHGHRRE